jgi:outer membrane lipase/esterase
MSSQWMRRGWLALVSVSLLLVAACGSGTIESQLNPSRIIVFGDALSDLGQTGPRYTVNDGSINIWTQQLASRFGVALATAASGGTSYATGNARVNTHPDAAGNNATPTVKEQIDTFLASNTIGANDLLVVQGGTSDIVAEVSAFLAGAQTRDQMLANVKQAGRDLAAQARRLVQAGAQHVVVVGPYHMGKSPWAIGIAQVDLLTEASQRFNDDLLVTMVDLGANVLYVDAAAHFNLMVAFPPAYELTNVVDPVCTSVDPGPGIGTGAGQLNSALCNTGTLAAANYNNYLFADRVYPVPNGHRKFGDYAYDRIRARW